ncbi:MAG: Ig-like domain-containing protein, partial [Psychrosphaera sp.]|nr:Ig-like domain-containing protein [Psychrosphaera sp.]
KTDPTVTISGTSGPVNALFSATFTFNEDVTGFVQTDITVANATLGNFIASNAKTYTVDVTPTIDGPVTLDVAAGVATDSATNGNTAATQYSVTYDATHPTLLITGPTATINGPFTTTFTFSEDVTGFELADIVVGNASVADFTALNASAKIYTAVVTPTTDGQQVTVDVAASVAIDTSTNPNVAASQFSVGYDTQKPGVEVTGPAAPLNTTFTATLTFSKAVLDFSQSKITVVNASLSNFDATNAPIYTVLVTPITDGDVSVSVAAAVVSDAPGNTNVASNVFTLVYDTTNPTIVSLAPANNEVDVAIKPDLVITFDEAVTAGTTNNLIEIKDLTNNAVLQSFAANSSAVSINDKVVTITLTSQLAEATEFYVTIGTNAFIDTATNLFAGISDTATWHFKIINLPPLTVADNAVVLEDTSVIIDVLNNDNGDNSALNPASVIVKTDASNGTTTVNTALGMITYAPNLDFNGTDTFTY